MFETLTATTTRAATALDAARVCPQPGKQAGWSSHLHSVKAEAHRYTPVSTA
jgi:hypothetical protein